MIFKNIIQYFIENGILTFPNKRKEKEVKEIDNNPFPTTNLTMVLTNISNLTKLRTKINLRQTSVIRILKRSVSDVNDHGVKGGESGAQLLCTRHKHKVKAKKES